jgi:preprotein translocase subunit SecG
MVFFALPLVSHPSLALLLFDDSSGSQKLFARKRRGKDHQMSPFLLVFLVLFIGIGVYSSWSYRTNKQKQAREKRRNQYNDRV